MFLSQRDCSNLLGNQFHGLKDTHGSVKQSPNNFDECIGRGSPILGKRDFGYTQYEKFQNRNNKGAPNGKEMREGSDGTN